MPNLENGVPMSESMKAMEKAHGIVELGDPELEKYLLLYVTIDENGDDTKNWEEFEGRTSLYEFIKSNLETEENIIRPEMSFVNGENDTYSTRRSVVIFMDTLSKVVYNDGFNVNNYIINN